MSEGMKYLGSLVCVVGQVVGVSAPLEVLVYLHLLIHLDHVVRVYFWKIFTSTVRVT